jgi:hypothetical protein
MRTLLADLAFALRQLIKHRVYAITAIVSMALGIAATAAVYSVLHAVLIDPFPYQDANRIAVINLHDKETKAPFRSLSLKRSKCANQEQSPTSSPNA